MLGTLEFSSIDGLDAVLENDPWFIRNNSLILKNEDGLSAIATKIGTPLMLDSYTSDRLAVPKLVGEGFYTCNVRVEYEWKPPRFENDVDLGTNGGTSNMASKKVNSSGSSFWNVESSSTSTTPIVEKIDKIERLIIDRKDTLMDDEVKPLTKVDSSGNHDSKDEVTSVDNDMVNFLSSKKVGYGTNSLLELWKKS
ncbi:hypothetical protein Tco_1208406 [Tanacetum coccineum]